MIPDYPTLPNWRLDALCTQYPPEMFFPEGKGEHCRDAIQVCRACPVAALCLLDALAVEATVGQEPWGIRGGVSARTRRGMIRRVRGAAA